MLTVRSAPGVDEEAANLFLYLGRDRLPRGGGLPDELFRFGIEFSDGRKATTLDWERLRPPGEPPRGPVLTMLGGGGDDRRWDQRYWVWPLPPPGPLAFVCEWPALGIALSRVDVDAELVLEAAARAEPLWTESDQAS